MALRRDWHWPLASMQYIWYIGNVTLRGFFIDESNRQEQGHRCLSSAGLISESLR